MSVPICNHFHVRRANSGRITAISRIMKFLRWATTKTLGFLHKILCRCVKRFPLNEGLKKGLATYEVVILPLSTRHKNGCR